MHSWSLLTIRIIRISFVPNSDRGKSLTYQLPALLEGRSQSRKITLVVSPLLSLIRDQEEQMNEFTAGSALAFTSGIGTSEQTRRWNLVRDRNSGVCIIFVTPERVFKSNKLRSELEKLNDQNRLGRFVIDECKLLSYLLIFNTSEHDEFSTQTMIRLFVIHSFIAIKQCFRLKVTVHVNGVMISDLITQN